MNRHLGVISAVVVAGAIGISMMAVTRAAGPGETTPTPAKANWPMANGDLANSHYSGLTQIDTKTVKNLGVAWLSDKFDDAASSRVTPVVQDGVMFISAGAKVYALDAKTGKTIWKTSTVVGGGPTGGRGVPTGAPSRQGVSVGEGKIFVATTDAHMIALDEKTGALIWNRDTGEDITPAMRVGTGITASPVYANGVIYTAITFQEGRYIGRMLALDAKDGHQIWRWNAIPGPGEPGHETWPQNNSYWKMGGADSWQPPAVDLDLGLVYYGTGNPSPNRQSGGVRAGNNLYSSSVVALDIKTGKLRWYFQAIHHDMWEGDMGTPNVMYDTQVNGVARKALAALRPDGTVFLFDRATGKAIWPVEERPVRQDPLLKTAPTQPYPVGRKSLTERDCSELKAPAGFVIHCDSGLFEPPSDNPPNILRYYQGIRNVPMSFNPQTGYIYLQGSDELYWTWASSTSPTWDGGQLGFFGSRVPDLEKQDIMTYAAFDPKTYKIVWKKQFPMPTTIYGSGGFLSTAGGLAFHRLDDGNLVAWDAKTGDELWKFQTGVADSTTIQTATPMTYEVDGQQYLSIILLNQVWSFKLGGDLAQRPAPKPRSREDVLRGPVEDSQLIKAFVPNEFNYRHQISPLKTRVKGGVPVTFLNNGAEIHTFEAMDGTWTTGELLPRQQAILTFDKAGTYLYHCKEHPWSYGLLIVTAQGAATATTNSASPPGSRASGNERAANREQAGGPSSGAEGFAAQVARGKSAYEQQCSSCHQADFSGNDFIPALAGSAFLSRWQGRPAKDLLDKTRTTMPPTTPGSLSAETYFDLIAFLMQANNITQRGAVSAESLNVLTIP